MNFWEYSKSFFVAHRVYALAILSGGLLALSLPPLNFSIFVWIGFLPLLFALEKGASSKTVFQAGVLAGIIYAIKTVYPLFSLNAWWWFDVEGLVEASKVLFLFWILFFIVVVASLFFGLFIYVYYRYRRKTLFDAVLFATVWAAIEYVRAFLFAGFTWGHFGYALYDELYLVQFAGIASVYGLSFLIIWVNIAMHTVLRDRVYARSFKGGSFKEHFSLRVFSLARDVRTYLIIGVFCVFVCYGTFVVYGQKAYGSTLRVAVIQPGLETQELSKDSFSKLFDLVGESLSQNAQLVLLPENIIPFLVLDEDTREPSGYENSDLPGRSVYEEFVGLSKQYPNTSFVFGMHSLEDSKVYNSLIVLEQGVVRSVYHKRYLMPFAEGSLKWIPVLGVENFAEGKGARVVVAGKPVVSTICSEIIFPELFSGKDSAYMINIGIDSVFDNPIVMEQNHIIARVRAVENRKYLLRSMKTGISSIIDPTGRVMESVGKEGSGVLVADILLP